jgi:hypothetical protein
MKYLVLATAAITTMSSGAIARQYIEGQELAEQNLQDVRAKPVSSDQQGAGRVIRIAMGPTSRRAKAGRDGRCAHRDTVKMLIVRRFMCE